jgi:DNA topoisomerase-2
MHLFDADDKLKKYEMVEEIIDDYFETRLKMYHVRKEYLIEALEKELVILSNKARYIQELLDDTIDLRKKKKVEIITMLQEKGYIMIDEDNEYKYLVRMPMDSVSDENVNKLNKEHKDKSDELERIKETTIQQMWLSELHELEKEYIQYREERTQTATSEKKKSSGKIVTKQGGVKKVVKKGIVNLVEEL